MNPNQYKVLIPNLCPHCKKPFILEMLSSAPELIGMLTEDSIKEAKDEAIRQIAAISIAQDIKKEAIDWVKNGQTFFSSNDIPSIIENLTKEPDDQLKKTTT